MATPEWRIGGGKDADFIQQVVADKVTERRERGAKCVKVAKKNVKYISITLPSQASAETHCVFLYINIEKYESVEYKSQPAFLSGFSPA